MYNFDPYNVLLSIATNIPVLLMTAFVLQGHIFVRCYLIFRKTMTIFKRHLKTHRFREHLTAKQNNNNNSMLPLSLNLSLFCLVLF